MSQACDWCRFTEIYVRCSSLTRVQADQAAVSPPDPVSGPLDIQVCTAAGPRVSHTPTPAHRRHTPTCRGQWAALQWDKQRLCPAPSSKLLSVTSEPRPGLCQHGRHVWVCVPYAPTALNGSDPHAYRRGRPRSRGQASTSQRACQGQAHWGFRRAAPWDTVLCLS